MAASRINFYSKVYHQKLLLSSNLLGLQYIDERRIPNVIVSSNSSSMKSNLLHICHIVKCVLIQLRLIQAMLLHLLS